MKLTHQQHPLSRRRYSPSRHSNPSISQPDAESKLARRVRLLVNAACAARTSGAHMTLSDWRDVEREMKQRLENEEHEAPR